MHPCFKLTKLQPAISIRALGMYKAFLHYMISLAFCGHIPLSLSFLNIFFSFGLLKKLVGSPIDISNSIKVSI